MTTPIEKRHELSGNKIFYRDNSCLHVAISFEKYLSKCNIKVMQYFPYWPDLVQSDFLLFPTLKEKLRSRQFNADSEVISVVSCSLK